MYLTRIYIPSNTRLELWRCSRLVGLSVLIKLRDGGARERRSNIYKRPLGGSCRISSRVSSEAVSEAAVGTEGFAMRTSGRSGARSTSASNSTPKSHRPKWRINIYY